MRTRAERKAANERADRAVQDLEDYASTLPRGVDDDEFVRLNAIAAEALANATWAHRHQL